MIRLICRVVDVAAAANVGGPVDESFKTFDVDLPTVEEWLRKATPPPGQTQWATHRIIGAELLEPESPKP